jgi:hypothetical protein
MLGRLRPYRHHHRVGLVAISVGVVLAASPPADAVVGGAPAPPGRWPWMVALLDASQRDAGWAQFCGGVVIGPRRVLTAGHCVIGQRSRDIDVLVGRTRLSEDDGQRLRVRAISVFAAVLELAAESGVPPLALARPGQEAAWAPGTPAWTMGWGQVNAGESPGGNRYYADRLRELHEPVQGDDSCESVFGLGFPQLPYRPTWLLCAGTPGDRAGTCSGDSGAPLVVGGPDSWLNVGLDVAGDACAAPGYFDLYVRVDRISSFALRRAPTVQPDPLARPRIAGRLRTGARVRCVYGRWGGSRASFSVQWRRLGNRSHSIVGRHRRYRLTKRDVKAGVKCWVTAANAGGRVTVAARPLRPHVK